MVGQKDVKEVAENARINLEEGEAEKFAEEFEDILETFQKLSEIDTENVDPAFHPVETGSESRKDNTEEPLDKEEVFQNTGNEQEGMFKGPSV